MMEFEAFGFGIREVGRESSGKQEAERCGVVCLELEIREVETIGLARLILGIFGTFAESEELEFGKLEFARPGSEMEEICLERAKLEAGRSGFALFLFGNVEFEEFEFGKWGLIWL